MSKYRIYKVRYRSFNSDTREYDTYLTETYYQCTPFSNKQVKEIRKQAYAFSWAYGRSITADIFSIKFENRCDQKMIASIYVIAMKYTAHYHYFQFTESSISNCSVWTGENWYEEV